MNILEINTENLGKYTPKLRQNQKILLSGIVYTARDAAHKRIVSLIDDNQPLPFRINNAVIYYAGPTPAPPNLPIGSCGPTTSERMDPYTEKLLALGLQGMIGKGKRSADIEKAIRNHNAIYLSALGGAGALCSKSVRSCEVVAFEDLGCESVKRLTIERLPLIVTIV